MAKASRSATGCVARCCVLAEATLRRNHVAAFLTLLRNMFIPSSVNQDTLLRENAIATLAHLLQNVDGHLLDGAVLVAVQWCVTDVTAANNFSLLQQLYKYLLFDFRLWSRSSVDVRKGKVQLSLNLSSHVLVLNSFSLFFFLFQNISNTFTRLSKMTKLTSGRNTEFSSFLTSSALSTGAKNLTTEL